MKKKIYIVLIALICLTLAVSVAKIATSAVDETASVVTEVPIEEETVIEGESTSKTPIITTEEIVNWVKGHLEEILVIITTIVLTIYQKLNNSSTNKYIATCNNNAVAIAENSNSTVATALTELAAMAALVAKCKDEINELLAEIRLNDEEKKQLQAALTNNESYLKTAKLANVELANEVAELLVLANIPISKKEELYSRHRAAVAAINAADHNKTEVNEDVGEEA